jgi:hypothetical protein
MNLGNQPVDNPKLDLEYWLGMGDPADAEFSKVLNELWAEALSLEQKLDLAWQLFHQAPSTNFIMHIVIRYAYDPARSEILDEALFMRYASMLKNQEDKLIQEIVEYSLYYDLLSDEQWSEQAWNALLNEAGEDDYDYFEILFRNAGPVLWEHKFPRLIRMAEDKKHHLAIYMCIRHSLYDPKGSIRKGQAIDLYSELDMDPYMDRIAAPKGYPSLVEVQERLQELNIE